MSGPVNPLEVMLPRKVEACGNTVRMGERIYSMSQPEGAIRWVLRKNREVLQQRWTVTGQDENGWNHIYQEWRDVPLEDEHA